MCTECVQNVLNVHGSIVPRRSFRRLTQIEEDSETEKLKWAEFNKIITSKLGNLLYIPPKSKPYKEENVTGEDDEINPKRLVKDDANYKIDEQSAFEHSLHDSLICAEVLLPRDDKMRKGIVKERYTNEKGGVTS